MNIDIIDNNKLMVEGKLVTVRVNEERTDYFDITIIPKEDWGKQPAMTPIVQKGQVIQYAKDGLGKFKLFVKEYGLTNTHLRIRRMEQRDGSYKWAIYNKFKDVYDRESKEFKTEPFPSEMTDELRATTRFDSFEDITIMDAAKVDTLRM